MNCIELIRRLHQHRTWVNAKLLVAAETLSESQLHANHEIGQGSIWRTLTHLYAADYVWLEALRGDEDPVTPGDAPGKLPGNQLGPTAMSSLRQLQERWKNLDRRWQDHLAATTEDSLGEIVYKKNSLTGKLSGTRRIDILLHVCTHAQYTTAQAINMMRHAGVSELPDTMLISMARAEQADGPARMDNEHR